MGKGKKQGQLLKGLCTMCNKDCYYILGRNWLGKNEILCNGCLNYAMRAKRDQEQENV